MNRYALILAGGTGSRLWPISRKNHTKQFIELYYKKPMLLETLKRLNGSVPYQNCFIVTGNNQKEHVQTIVKDLLIPPDNIICEPFQRNTCACMGLSVLYILEKFGNGVLSCFPSDSHIADTAKFQNTIENLYTVAEASDSLTVIGISPSCPSTAYGYMKLDTPHFPGNSTLYSVKKFHEKPDIQRAKRFIKSGDYYWNSGIICGTLTAFVRAFLKWTPSMYDNLMSLFEKTASDDGYEKQLAKVYSSLDNISFDHAVLEKSKDILAVTGDFGWTDIGSLDALENIASYDNQNNAIIGKHIELDTKNCIIYNKQGLIATIGLENLMIIQEEDIVLVCAKEKSQDVKKLVEKLRSHGLDDYL